MVLHQSWDKISRVQLDNEFPYILTEWYLPQYDQLLIAGWFKLLWSHILCFGVIVSLLAPYTSVEIGNSILHLNTCERWNLARSTRPMPKLNKHFYTVFIWIIFSLHCRRRASLVRDDLPPVSFLLPLKGVKGFCTV